MNSKTELGRLEKIDLRKVWLSEPGDFMSLTNLI